MVNQLEFDTLHWLNSFNIDHVDSSSAILTRNFEEKLAGLIFISQEIELKTKQKVIHEIKATY